VTPLRCPISWQQCLTPVNIDFESNYSVIHPLSHVIRSILDSSTLYTIAESSPPPSPVSDIESEHEYDFSTTNTVENIHIIDTPYIIDHTINKKKPLESKKADGIWKWTKKQRKRAEKAKVASDVNDLKEKVSDLNIFCKQHTYSFCLKS
jgi:hypothetical protein